jgi:antitoxin (DNA-binding transcriptional repressor) of toxin-antitoxin stability system
MQQINIHQVKSQLERVFQATLNGEEVLITQDSQSTLKIDFLYKKSETSSQ